MIILGIFVGLFCAGLITALCTWLLEIIVSWPMPLYMASALCGVTPLFFGGLAGSAYIGLIVAGAI